MTIRNLCQTDYEAVLSMMKTFYASNAVLVHPEESVLRKTLTDSIRGTPHLRGFGFDVDGLLAGYGMVAISYSTEAGGLCAWIEDIYIKPQYRGQGIGSSFLTFVREHYRDQVVRIRLEAEPENTHAMAVYRKAGFEILGYTQLVQEL